MEIGRSAKIAWNSVKNPIVVGSFKVETVTSPLVCTLLMITGYVSSRAVYQYHVVGNGFSWPCTLGLDFGPRIPNVRLWLQMPARLKPLRTVTT